MFNNNVSLKNDFKVVNNNVNNSNQQDGPNFFSNSLQNPNNHRLNFLNLNFTVNVQSKSKTQPTLIPLKPLTSSYKLQPKPLTQMKTSPIVQIPPNLQFMYQIPAGFKNPISIITQTLPKIKQVTLSSFYFFREIKINQNGRKNIMKHW
jgi:hypothetical protein